MKKIDKIMEAYPNDTFLVAEGFDKAIIGVYFDIWGKPMENPLRLVYSVKKCIQILMKDMSEEDAREYFEFNTRGGYVGEQTPVWVDDEY
jgi:hypothetical protein